MSVDPTREITLSFLESHLDWGPVVDRVQVIEDFLDALKPYPRILCPLIQEARDWGENHSISHRAWRDDRVAELERTIGELRDEVARLGGGFDG